MRTDDDHQLRVWVRNPDDLIRQAVLLRHQRASVRGIMSRDPEMPAPTAPPSGEFEWVCLATRDLTADEWAAWEWKIGHVLVGRSGKALTYVGVHAVGPGMAPVDLQLPGTVSDRELSTRNGWSPGRLRELLQESRQKVQARVRGMLDRKEVRLREERLLMESGERRRR